MDSKRTYDNILEAIGNTPMIRLNSVSSEVGAEVYAKVESFNPGLSTKDRAAFQMIKEAETKGILKEGGTVVEASSGNTGMSMALICAVRGYRCIIAIPDKSSKEKVSQLRALGAYVIVCPSNVSGDHPESYYSVAKRIAESSEGAVNLNQYYNNSNPDGHYKTTGPEIWEQSDGKIDYFVATAGTGGTISGTAKYLKEQNPDIKIVGVDAVGSVLKGFKETGKIDEAEKHPYLLEAVGKTFIPGSMHMEFIDKFVKASDRKSAMRARKLAKREAIFSGYSSGAAIEGVYQIKDELKPSDMVVVLLPDHGSKYMSKIYNEEWMRQNDLSGYKKLRPYYHTLLPPKFEKVKLGRFRKWIYLRS